MASINLGRVVGDPGPKGDRGTVWHLGTGVTGQSTTGTVFSGSGVESAALQDMYLNTNTDDFYTCVLAGNAATAKWAYAGNLKGATGPQGATGPTGKVDSNTPVTFETAATETDINSGESLGTLMGKIKKSISTFRSAIGTLSSLKTSAKTSLVAAINEIFAANNDLSQGLAGKANADHTHTAADVTDLSNASVNYASSAGSANTVAWGNVAGRPNIDNMVLALRNFTDFNNAPDGVSMFDVTQDIANSPGVNSGYLFQNTVQVGGYILKYQVVLSSNGLGHYTRTQWYNTWGSWTVFNFNKIMQKQINVEIPNRTEQRYGNISVVTTDYQGVNAVSGFDSCLCLHMAVDIRDIANNHLSTMGFISGSQYYYYDISRLNLGMNVNNNGTCAITGGDSAFIKQVFILIPQVDYSEKS